MVAAPFLALLFDLAAGLAVMAIALGATAWLALDAARTAEPTTSRRLRILAGVNGALVVMCLAALVVDLG
jgi:hypothetical protein